MSSLSLKLFTIYISTHKNMRRFTRDIMNFHKLYFDPRKELEKKIKPLLEFIYFNLKYLLLT